MPRSGWPFLITPGVSAPTRTAVVPAPVARAPELLIDWTRQVAPIDGGNRVAHQVRLPGRRTGWAAHHNIVPVSDGVVRVLDREHRRTIRLSGHTGRITTCAFSADEQWLVTAGWDRSLRIWSVADGKLLATRGGHEAWVSGVAVNPANNTILSTSWDGGVRAFPISPDDRPAATWTMSAPLVTGCAVTPDGSHLVSAGADHLIRVVDLGRPGSAARLLDGHHDEITTCVISPDGQLVVSGSRDRTLMVRVLSTGEQLARLRGHRDWVSSAAFTADGRRLVSAGWDGQVLRWDLDRKALDKVLVAHSAILTGSAVVPRDDAVCTTDVDGTLRWWDGNDGRPQGVYEIGKGTPGGCVASPSGRYVAILSLDDGPDDTHPARDRAGRPITMTEGVLYVDRPEPKPLTDLDLAHLHAVSLSGFGRYSATEGYGGDVAVSEELEIPGWTRPAPRP
ncbi:WD domain-containing protein, G-beta repeat-containing protein [Actinoplanes cyaneus]|nr:WD domain-containing protein, G-beta repeat-containing protein [Actinoplanes cyaneus]